MIFFTLRYIQAGFFNLWPNMRVLKCPSFWLILFISIMGFSCGLANYKLNSGGTNSTLQNSQAQGQGVFVSPAGRLTSQSTCIDNTDCVQMCDSMLNRLSLQKECYDLKEEEVQALRDTFNLLALGRPNRLAKVDPEEMEKFLKFSPELYKSAIYGFRRGWKEGCTPNLRPSDPRDREDCKLKNYYQQDGYHSGSSSYALEWIASNNWLAEMLLEHDQDYIIMLSLLDILANGGQHPIEGSDKNKTCNIGDNTNTVGVVTGGICPFIKPTDSTYHGRLNIAGTPANTNSPTTTTQSCDWDKDSSTGTQGEESQRNWPSSPDPKALVGSQPPVASSFDDYYKAFGADCVGIDSKRKNYFMVAVAQDNPYSVNLGHQVLREKLCNNNVDAGCQLYFYCTIQDNEKEQTITYMKANSEIKGTTAIPATTPCPGS